MVVGLLVTSLGSGAIVGRTGRYKIFPVAGTAVMAIGFVLLSLMDSSTSIVVQSLYLLVLGAGIGLSMQVLILIVQNTVDFADLGVATSGVTFFRTIGSSFGAAIFGSMFTNFLTDRLPAALAASGAPPEATNSPQALHQLPHQVAAPIIDAYADSLSHVFLFAAPVAVVGFVLSLFLKQVPLRDAAASGSTDMGEGFGMPTTESPEKLLEIAVGRLLRQSRGVNLQALSQNPGSRLDVPRLWALMQVYRHAQQSGSAHLADIVAQHRVPRQILEPAFEGLVRSGYAERTGDSMWLTPAGASEVNFARNAIASWITETLARSRNSRDAPIACRSRARSNASRAACCCSATGPVRRPGRSTSEGRPRGRARPLCACPPNPRANWPRLPHDLSVPTRRSRTRTHPGYSAAKPTVLAKATPAPSLRAPDRNPHRHCRCQIHHQTTAPLGSSGQAPR